MNWLAVLVTAGAFAAAGAGFVLLGWAQRKTDTPKLVRLEDADTVPIQRREVTAEQRIRWRASEAWMEYAEADFDWRAAEHQMRKEAS